MNENSKVTLTLSLFLTIIAVASMFTDSANAGEKGSKFSIKAGTGDGFVISVMPAEEPWQTYQPRKNAIIAETVLEGGAHIIITIESDNTELTKMWSGYFIEN